MPHRVQSAPGTAGRAGRRETGLGGGRDDVSLGETQEGPARSPSSAERARFGVCGAGMAKVAAAGASRPRHTPAGRDERSPRPNRTRYSKIARSSRKSQGDPPRRHREPFRGGGHAANRAYESKDCRSGHCHPGVIWTHGAQIRASSVGDCTWCWDQVEVAVRRRGGWAAPRGGIFVPAWIALARAIYPFSEDRGPRRAG